MSILRIFGLTVGLIIIGIVFFRLRRHSENRLDIAILSFFGSALLMISFFPGLISLPAEILSLDVHERGRLLTLLILSTIALWLLLIYERGKTNFLSSSFDRLVRTMAIDTFIHDGHSIDPDSILILIPVYNEEKNLAVLIPTLPKEIKGIPVTLLIIDDGSSDYTASFCKDHGLSYARNLINRGGGAALRVGFDIALRADVRVIVTMDGDGQHCPEDIENLIGPILREQADLVIGSRILGQMERYSKLRYLGVIFFGKLISLILGQKVTDPASGFRAFNSKVFEICRLTQDQYHTAELIIEAIKNGLNVHERPIMIKKRLSGYSKKGKDFKYALFFLRTVLKTWIR